MKISKISAITLLGLMLASLIYANDLSHQYDNPKRLAKAKECIINGMKGDECQKMNFWEQDFTDLHYKTGNREVIQILTQDCEKSQNASLQAFACHTLGRIFLKGKGVFGKGKGVDTNYKLALDSFKKACDLKNATGCVYLADLYLYGYGTKTNAQLARQYYGKACDLGSQAGCDKYN